MTDGVVSASKPQQAERLKELRALLQAQGLGGFLIPRADEYQGEYIPPAAQRLGWLTGFTGSAGLAVVLADRAALFIDGRYVLQIEAQTDTGLFSPIHISKQKPEDWIAETLPQGAVLGYDPWLLTDSFRQRLLEKGIDLAPCSANLIDALWHDRPAPPAAPILPHPVAWAGKSSADKRADLAAAMSAEAAIITAPDSIAWLLNIRGGDVECSPLPLSFAIFHRDGTVDWFVDPLKRSADLDGFLGAQIRAHPPSALALALEGLGRAGRKVMLDPAHAPVWILDRLKACGAEVFFAEDPCLLPKACKNPVEVAGAQEAHKRDGVAVVRFLAWLAHHAPQGGISEIAAADRLDSFRREHPLCRDLSFPTISGSGPNGAIIHYRATQATDRMLRCGELYLVDSGAQYPDGTTDITRTVAIGEIGAEEKRAFTLVLKGHIALARACFPMGTTGGQLDALARQYLWRDGLDYDHGTGHGVGSYLGVHEGPQRISKAGGGVSLAEGMIVSNEPGYYRAGRYGIRIEALQVVVKAKTEGFLAFHTLTLAPIDRKCLDLSLLSPDEKSWLDLYHSRIYDELSPLLAESDRAWFYQETRPC